MALFHVRQLVQPLATAAVVGGILFSTAVPAQAQEVSAAVDQTIEAQAFRQSVGAIREPLDETQQEFVHAALANPEPLTTADDDRVAPSPTATTAVGAQSAVAASDSSPRATVVGSSITDTALRYLGVPYVWGGASPAGFDCSGFTSFVYGLHGKSLPHSSSAQRALGTVVSESSAQPGDLVWWPGHIAIYLGNGKIVHALEPGSTVVVGAVGDLRGSAPTYLRF
ncbi:MULTISPECIES: C40 family peptidase [unclassified Pseudoclavibacter]|uniref:C40 family peptidase n=1 Tax=unclassified Pseudoclavibacter TaxID=2615177 RepID=UPI001300DDD0|nr:MULTISPECIES: C40 family peptidase [unclassified Pseudoclavibacter]KAB1647291.1 NlpC/P60 family protein [Pseudoclavibacter sp. CFCC 14310]KAB1662716.1 NlpC/P60 family protein [Pseudoclavibacter sp. CFCC 13611]